MSEQLPHICEGGHDVWDEPEGEARHYRVTPGYDSRSQIAKSFACWLCDACAELDRRHGHKVEEIGAHEQ